MRDDKELLRRTDSAMTTTKATKFEFPFMSSSVIAANEDLLSEILYCLPMKSICRFKCVTKHWNSVIVNSQFCHRRSRQHCKKITRIFVLRKSASKYDIIPLHEFGKGSGASFSKSLKYADDDDPMKILQSCNGLLCCRTGGVDSLFGNYNYYICNPTTHQFSQLPNPIDRDFRTIDGVESVLAVNLAFDPRKSPHFKVLCVFFSQTGGNQCQIEIYSSETREWRRTGGPFTGGVNFRNGVYWNGAVNWLNLFTGDGLYFNVDEERLGKLPMLPLPNHVEERGIMYFGESYDHLHLIELYDPSATQFDVYEMDREYSGWSVRYSIDIEVVLKAFLKPTVFSYHRFQILSVVSGENDADSFVVVSIQGKAVSYNISEKSFKKIWDFGKSYGDSGIGWPVFDWSDTFQYIESICAV